MAYLTISRIAKGLKHPRIALQYLYFFFSRGVLKLNSGASIKGFIDFNEYLGTKHNQPDSKELLFLEVVPEERGVVIDVGANVGVFTLGVLSKRPTADVYCFEPAPPNYERLKDNIARNGFKASLQCMAVSSGESPNVVEFSADIKSPSTMHFAEENDSHRIKVKVTTLDEFCHQQRIKKVNLLKIDVEGYEMDVLKGAANLMSTGAVKNILIEVCPQNLHRAGRTVESLWAAWTALGYVAYKLPSKINEKPTGVSLEDCKHFACENILLRPRKMTTRSGLSL